MNLPDYLHFHNVELSQITDSEIDETVELINPAYSYQEKAKGSTRTNAQHLRKRVSETDFYVVKAADKIIGCVYVEPKDDSLHFGLLTLAPSHRKTGLAAAIMKALEDYAVAQHYKALELEYMSLAPWLGTYYGRHGFTETGVVTSWGTIDLVHMSKRL